MKLGINQVSMQQTPSLQSNSNRAKNQSFGAKFKSSSAFNKLVKLLKTDQRDEFLQTFVENKDRIKNLNVNGAEPTYRVVLESHKGFDDFKIGKKCLWGNYLLMNQEFRVYDGQTHSSLSGREIAESLIHGMEVFTEVLKRDAQNAPSSIENKINNMFKQLRN